MEIDHLFDFDTPIDRRNTASMKWDKYKDQDIIPLWVADMDFRSPPPVIETLKHRIDHGIFGYTHPPEELVSVIVSMLHTRYHWTIRENWIVWLPGLVTGLNVVCKAVGEPGDDVMTTVPVYPPFLSAPKHARRNLVVTSLVYDGVHWSFDFDRLTKKITPRSKLFLLCSPHNPTGRVFTRKELLAFAEICEKNHCIICSDEIHCDLVLARDRFHTPIAALSDEIARRTITLMSPSKTFNLPGLGCSFAIIPDRELRIRFSAAMAGIVPHVNALGYTAALAAYRDGWPWHKALIEYLRGNLALVESSVNQMNGVSMGPVEATYLAWINMTGTGVENPVSFFEKAGVGLSEGSSFTLPGHVGSHYVRLNFACPRSLLLKALERMIAVVEKG